MCLPCTKVALLFIMQHCTCGPDFQAYMIFLPKVSTLPGINGLYVKKFYFVCLPCVSAVILNITWMISVELICWYEQIRTWNVVVVPQIARKLPCTRNM